MRRMVDYRKIKAIEDTNKKRWLKVNPDLSEDSGIYILTRIDEEEFKFGYIGQAKHILTRLAKHLAGYQHIDLSLKKHGLYSEKNPFGWNVESVLCNEKYLDDMEKKYIKQYADAGFQLRNKTSGSQSAGKNQIADYKPVRGYRDGLEQGRMNCSREISRLFDLHLNVSCKSDKPNKRQENALNKFQDFLDYHKKEK